MGHSCNFTEQFFLEPAKLGIRRVGPKLFWLAAPLTYWIMAPHQSYNLQLPGQFGNH